MDLQKNSWIISMTDLCDHQNLLDNFHKHDVLTVAAKIFLFFQMLTVFPLIMYILRSTSTFYILSKSIDKTLRGPN